MKLLMVTHYFESHRGGIEIAAGQLAREIARLGHDLIWLAADTTPPPRAIGCTTVCVRAANTAEAHLGVPYPVPSVRSILQIINQVGKVDAVLLHDGAYLTTVATFLTARWFRKPIIVVQHVGEIPYRNRILRTLMRIGNHVVVRPLLTHADQVIFDNQSTARHFCNVRFRNPPQVVFNGVDTRIFQPLPDAPTRAERRQRLGLPNNQPVILFVGRFVEKKGLQVVEHMARLRPDFFWGLVGWGPFDPADWRLPNVQVFSDVSGDFLASLYQAADAFVLPSIGEGFPLVVQEALACGLPVVCGADTARADSEATPLLWGIAVDHHKPERTAGEFCNALDLILSDFPCEREQMRKRFRFVSDRYVWRNTAERYIEIMRSLLAT